MIVWELILAGFIVSVFGVTLMKLTDWAGQYFGLTIADGKFHWRWGKLDSNDSQSSSPRSR